MCSTCLLTHPDAIQVDRFMMSNSFSQKTLSDMALPTPIDLLLLKNSSALFAAAFLSTLLYGLMLHQTYRYFRSYAQDSVFIKSIVSIALALETAYTICNIHYCYHTFVTHYADFQTFYKIVWSGNLLPLLGISTGTATHIFFIRRVSLVGSRYRYLSVLAIVFHIIQTSFGLAIAIRGLRTQNPGVYHDNWMVGICTGFAVMADVSITGALFAVMHKGRDGRKSLVDMVTLYLVNTGTLVLILDVVTFVLAMAISQSLDWAAVNSVTSRVYTNTLLSVLNSRTLHAEYGIEVFSGGPQPALHTISRVNRLATLERWNVPEEPDPTPTKITINVSTERDNEDMSRVESQSGIEQFELAKMS
ncbi:hypothetical protein C8Q76DRAFT_8186 [Earliella scabrosa]|nr:hypothetical protein C8Q76DRAFT_8186 [Earliella scabrosa]